MGMQDGELNPEEIKSGKDRNRSCAEGVTMARQVVGNIGMFYAAYRLSQHGWNVMPTSRNARGVDLLAYDVSAHIFKRHPGQGALKTRQRPSRQYAR
jgi:hypothetical protein